MIYEIYFEPDTGRWRIRITNIYLFFLSWSKDVMTDGDTNHPLKVHEFDTYQQALEHATAVGLASAYRMRVRSEGYLTWVNAEGCHAQG